MIKSPTIDELLSLPEVEKIKRFDAMARQTYSHVDGRDLLDELHPRKQLDIKRRVDGRETWFEGDWLSNLRDERNGGHGWWLSQPDLVPPSEDDQDPVGALGSTPGPR